MISYFGRVCKARILEAVTEACSKGAAENLVKLTPRAPPRKRPKHPDQRHRLPSHRLGRFPFGWHPDFRARRGAPRAEAESIPKRCVETFQPLSPIPSQRVVAPVDFRAVWRVRMIGRRPMAFLVPAHRLNVGCAPRKRPMHAVTVKFLTADEAALPF